MGTATFVAIVVPILGAFIALALSLSGSKAEEEKARKRRIADARMNARLLRLNL